MLWIKSVFSELYKKKCSNVYFYYLKKTFIIFFLFKKKKTQSKNSFPWEYISKFSLLCWIPRRAIAPLGTTTFSSTPDPIPLQLDFESFDFVWLTLACNGTYIIYRLYDKGVDRPQPQTSPFTIQDGHLQSHNHHHLTLSMDQPKSWKFPHQSPTLVCGQLCVTTALHTALYYGGQDRTGGLPAGLTSNGIKFSTDQLDSV